MAWRSSGSTNEEMVNNLKRFGVISSEAVERGFRKVDRKFFVPKGNEDAAYSDQPLKEGSVHISAPHIYGSALEALELHENSSLSFLNIGSGTGYLSCIVAEILGTQSLNFGIEINSDVVRHSQQSINRWRSCCKHKQSKLKLKQTHLQIVHGNALNVTHTGESTVGFDRIYIGASVDRTNLRSITKLLSPGGILVGPVDDELVKIVRIGPLPLSNVPSHRMTQCDCDNDSTSDFEDSHHNDNEFTQQVLSGVRFAPLLTFPSMETTLPARIWNPELQPYFPSTFQRATEQIFLCSSATVKQPKPVVKPQETINFAAMLPKVIWIEILSYTHRKWFDSQQNETQFLKTRLIEEQQKAARAQQARIDAETRCHVAERERDVYRLLARRWQSRLQLILQQQQHHSHTNTAAHHGSSLSLSVSGGQRGFMGGRRMRSPIEEDEDEDFTHVSLRDIITSQERAAIFGLGTMLQHLDSAPEDTSTTDEHHDEDPNAVFFSANENEHEHEQSMDEDDDTEEYDHDHDEEEEEEHNDDAIVDGRSSSSSIMLVNDHQQLIDFLEQPTHNSNDEEEYDFQSLQSDEYHNQHHLLHATHDSQSIIMDEDDHSPMMVDKPPNHNVATVTPDKTMTSLTTTTSRDQIRTISMGSEDL